MTLIQKLNNSIITNINITESENRMYYDYNHLELAENCEVIADEFAIGFAEFSINYNYHPMHKVWIRYDKIANEKFTTKELLEIYKKEKGL